MKQNEIILIHGNDYKSMTIQLLEHAGLAEEIGDRRARIALKPNLVLDATADQGAVTHPEIVAGTVEYLHKYGFQHICIMEGSWVGARTSAAVRVSGIAAVCQKYNIPFIDLQKDGSHIVCKNGLELHVCDHVADVDFLINIPVLKGHCQTMITCAMKNLKGLIPNTEKRRFHSMGLHRPIAHLAAAIPQNFIIVDNICGDLDFEEGGNPVTMDRIFCCKDPVLCDSFGCQTLGISADEVAYIKMAEQLGVGCSDVSKAIIMPINACTVATPGKATQKVRRLERYIDSNHACSACYGMLIHALDKMDRMDALCGHTQKICIGQGYKNRAGEIGIGSCTKDFTHSLKGCPPSADEILHFLQADWK